MNPHLALGVSWGGRSRRPVAASVVAAVMAALFLLVPSAAGIAAADTASSDAVSVIVRRTPGSGTAADDAVRAAGGRVEASLAIIDGFSARVPAGTLASLRMRSGIQSITENTPLRLHSLLETGLGASEDDPGRFVPDQWAASAYDFDEADVDAAPGGGDEAFDDEFDPVFTLNPHEDELDDESEPVDGRGSVEPESESASTTAESTTEGSSPAATEPLPYDPKAIKSSMLYVTHAVTGAAEYWRTGHTGKGVDVALIDSGVAPVDGLRTPGKVLHGPDLSFESQNAETTHVDTFGHGTHLAGIIAGRDDGSPASPLLGDSKRFWGMAPDARIVSLKVADAYGNTDVSQVIAAIDWVVQHRRSHGLNIRVLTLAFGTDSVQDHRIDPLSFAVEVAWRRGLVVVVAAGNGGSDTARLNNPAQNPFVVAVGGADGRGTYTSHDDAVGDYSSRGDSFRSVDLVAPGTSIVSLRAPGSTVERHNVAGHMGERYLRGTGTSQAAAVVAGAAALVLEQRPRATPDEVKDLLMRTAQTIPGVVARAQGSGMLDLRSALNTNSRSKKQIFAAGTGHGSLDAARGTARLADEGGELRGEIDIFGKPFSSPLWAARAATDTAWLDGSWNGTTWTGSAWAGNRWSSVTWLGNRWSGNRWSADIWMGNRWSGNRWSGNRWSVSDW